MFGVTPSVWSRELIRLIKYREKPLVLRLMEFRTLLRQSHKWGGGKGGGARSHVRPEADCAAHPLQLAQTKFGSRACKHLGTGSDRRQQQVGFGCPAGQGNRSAWGGGGDGGGAMRSRSQKCIHATCGDNLHADHGEAHGDSSLCPVYCAQL